MALWALVLEVLVILLVASEAAFALGRRGRARATDEIRSHVATAQASTLGLLALLLAFALSMADSRYDARRRLLVLEANAIGTTYLRTKYLPEPVSTQSKQLLHDYVKSRRAYFEASATEAGAVHQRSESISNELWTVGAALASTQMESDMIALYLTSLNEVIDTGAARRAAQLARIPPSIRVLLLLIALIAVGVTGYSTGLCGRRVHITLTLLPVMITLSYSILADLDRPRSGFISTGDFPMIQLERQLDADRPAAASVMLAP